MKANGRKKSYERAALALLEHPTVAEAAHSVEVSETTLYRWMNEVEFQDVYRAARREVVRHSVARLQRACRTAVDTLTDVMECSESPASARVTAARAVLEMAFKAVELEDIEARVTALEHTGTPDAAAALEAKLDGIHAAMRASGDAW